MRGLGNGVARLATVSAFALTLVLAALAVGGLVLPIAAPGAWRRHLLFGAIGFGLGLLAARVPWSDTTTALAVSGGYAMVTLGLGIVAVWRSAAVTASRTSEG